MKKTFVLIIVALLFGSHLFAEEEARNALLIANGEYEYFPSLSEPVKEAENLCTALEELGFSVTLVINANLAEMRDAIDDFQQKIERTKGIAFFHYGGHAVQVGGKNYLIPLAVNIPDEGKVSSRSVNTDEIMASMVADANIVILDSCRNNPLPAGSVRSASRGLVLSAIKPRNSIIVYSAEAGSTAQDGVFTPILTEKILEAGKSILEVLKEVRVEVLEKTENSQCPGEYSQLTGDIYLAGKNISTSSLVNVDVEETTSTVLTGNLEITSQISGDVYLGGENAGTVNAYGTIFVKNIHTGRYKVEVHGEENLSEFVIIKAGETVKISLERNPETIKEESSIAVPVVKKEKSPRKNIFSVKEIDGISFGIETFYNFSWFSLNSNGKVTAVFESDKSYFPVGINIFPFSMTASHFRLKIGGGYTYSKTSIENEILKFHEADWLLLGLGADFSRIAFTVGFGISTVWEDFSYEVDGNTNNTQSAFFCMPFPIDLYFRFGKNVSIFGEYKPTIIFKSSLVLHSVNFGMRLDFYY